MKLALVLTLVASCSASTLMKYVKDQTRAAAEAARSGRGRDLEAGACGAPTPMPSPMPAFVASGGCGTDDECFYSPNHPEAYGNSDHC